MTTHRKQVILGCVVAVATLQGLRLPSASAQAADTASASLCGQVVSLDGPWLLATDPKNAGREGKWWTEPRPDARKTKVPWIIQVTFPGYHGVAWYWKDFEAPANPLPQGRTLLRFWQVDYKADVWLNGTHLGTHEGGESPFLFDVTAAVKPGAGNRLAVRVVNPSHDPIDGLVLNEIPHRNKALPYGAGSTWDQGGIWDSVELLTVPQAWIEDLFVRPDWQTGVIRIQANIRNAGPGALKARLQLGVAPAAGGSTLALGCQEIELKVGDTITETSLKVRDHRLWNLDDPFLYRVTARLCSAAGPAPGACGSVHEHSVRCGFRDFRFENGYFRLNGKRIYLRCSHTGNCCPIGLEMPHDPDFLRRDLVNQKMMRFNAIRFIAGVAKRYQLDLADEIGLMVYQENYAGWCLVDSPKMAERFDEATFGMIKRDRNHPSLTMWGLLNETAEGPVFRHAVGLLPEVRKLDDTRLVFLNSGRFDNAGGLSGIQIWRNGGQIDPCVNFNPTSGVVTALGITWQPGTLAFHPGPQGEYGVVRYTAPADYVVEFSASFKSIAAHATTDVHVLHNGRVLFDDVINLNNRGPETQWKATLTVKENDTIDFAVGRGNNDYGGDCTGLSVVAKSMAGKFDAAADFSIEVNGSGVWSYGMFAPGKTPNAKTFSRFTTAITEKAIGSLSNPGSTEWQDVLTDTHPYQRVPHTPDIVARLRTLDGGAKPVFISEYGIGSAVDLLRTCRWYEQAGFAHVEDARFYAGCRDQYLADWQRWRLNEVFDRPEDFFAQGNARMAGQRLLGLNAIRANPKVIGHSLTGTVDQGMTGEGVWTTFRELKPGSTDALFDAWAPLRWCLFAEPVNVYRKTPVKLEAVLANEDALSPGEYPVRLQVVGPNLTRVFEKTVTVKIADPKAKPEPPMVLPVFAGDVTIDGPPGVYRFMATFEKGAAACGEEIAFYLWPAPGELPKVDPEVTVVSSDAAMVQWLTDRGVRVRRGLAGPQTAREVILLSGKPEGDPAVLFKDLARRIARGSTAVFLTPETLARGDQSTGWLPLKTKGSVSGIARWLYHSDEWSKHHAIFEGLPTGGLMDYTVYRELIPDAVFMGMEPPADAVAGGINASQAYQSGLTVAVYKLGAGEFILNSLRIREHLSKQPVADRLLLNLLRFAGREAGKPLAAEAADLEARLKEAGYP